MNRKKVIASVVAVLSLFVCVYCGVYLYQYYHGINLTSSLKHNGEEVSAHLDQNSSDKGNAVNNESTSADPETKTDDNLPSGIVADEVIPVTLPVDFDELSKVNTDIYGWITIPNTVIDYPVVQHPYNDYFYLNHASDKQHYVNGSIFSEAAFNSKSFDDDFTVLYGHDIKKSDLMFSQLNNFIDAIYFDEHPEFEIYTPDKIYKYSVFAACPFGREHLLRHGIFDEKESFDNFFATLADKYPFDSNFREELFPEFGDRVLTLSTCYVKNHAQRFLVMAVCTEILEVTE